MEYILVPAYGLGCWFLGLYFGCEMGMERASKRASTKSNRRKRD